MKLAEVNIYNCSKFWSQHKGDWYSRLNLKHKTVSNATCFTEKKMYLGILTKNLFADMFK